MHRIVTGSLAFCLALLLTACSSPQQVQPSNSEFQPSSTTSADLSDLSGVSSDVETTTTETEGTTSTTAEGTVTDHTKEISAHTSVTTGAVSTTTTRKTTTTKKTTTTTKASVTSKTTSTTKTEEPVTTTHRHEWIKKITYPPTCTEQGYTEIRYSCGKVEKQDYVDALGHLMSEWVTETPATDKIVGKAKRICRYVIDGTRCPYEEYKEIPKLQLPNTTDSVKQQVLDLVNGHRKSAGLTELSYYTAEQAAADLRAKEIQTSFAHQRPNGTEFYTVFSGLGKDFFGCGENIAMGFNDAATVVQAWMDSPDHRANIMDPDFDAMVVGVSNGYWSQLFIDF